MPSTARYRIPVYFDFASTLCYVAHKVIERIAPQTAELDIEIDWQPIDLTSITGWQRGAQLNDEARQNVHRVMHELGVDAMMPARWTDSRPVQAVAIVLRDTPSGMAWRERVWSAIYEEGRVITEDGELERMARDLRIDLDDLDTNAGLESLSKTTRTAHSSGVSGVPTFMLDEWPVGGVQEDRTMISLFERYVRKKEREAES